jgi:K(+)-stimulated pyrophosphate-energized sodium pump
MLKTKLLIRKRYLYGSILLYVGIVSGLLSVGVAVYLYFWVMRQDAGSEKAQQVAGWIREGAASYLKRLYSALTLVAVILGWLLPLYSVSI